MLVLAGHLGQPSSHDGISVNSWEIQAVYWHLSCICIKNGGAKTRKSPGRLAGFIAVKGGWRRLGRLMMGAELSLISVSLQHLEQQEWERGTPAKSDH